MLFNKVFKPNNSDQSDLNFLLLGLPGSGKSTLLRRIDYFANYNLATQFSDRNFGARGPNKPWLKKPTKPTDQKKSSPLTSFKFKHETQYPKAAARVKSGQKLADKKQRPTHNETSMSSSSSTGSLISKAFGRNTVSVDPETGKITKKPKILPFHDTNLNLNFKEQNLHNLNQISQALKDQNLQISGIILLVDVSNKETIDSTHDALLELLENFDLDDMFDGIELEVEREVTARSKFEAQTRPTSAAVRKEIKESQAAADRRANRRLPILILGTFADKSKVAYPRDLYEYLDLQELAQKYGDSVQLKIFSTSNLFAKIDLNLECGISWATEQALRAHV